MSSVCLCLVLHLDYDSVVGTQITLGWAILTLLAVCYMFAAVAMALFQSDYTFPDVDWETKLGPGNNPAQCETLMACARDHLQYGLHSPPVWFEPTNFGQWLFDMCYFFFVTLFLTEMITAFLFDTFFKVDFCCLMHQLVVCNLNMLMHSRQVCELCTTSHSQLRLVACTGMISAQQCNCFHITTDFSF